MARWLLLGLTILGFGVVFIAKSPGLLAFGLVLGMFGFLGFVLALAADRISASARPEASMASGEDFSVLGQRRAAATVPPGSGLPTAASGGGEPKSAS